MSGCSFDPAMNAHISALSGRERWALYVTFAALPGACVFTWLGLYAAVAYEILVWIPQQRLFDHLRLAETLPFVTGRK